MVRILVVEDSPMNRKILEVLLRGHGYEPLEAEDGNQAMEIISEDPPDLILMDMQLPGIDGYELTRRLRQDPATKDIPIIAVTANAMAGDDRKALDAGCDAYVAKPIDTRTFPELIASYLQGRR